MAKLSLDTSKFDKGLDDSESKAKGFGGKLSSALGTAGKVAAGLGTAAVGAGAAVYGMAKKSAEASDRIDKMSQMIGVSRTTFQEFDFIASQSGTDVEKLRGGMKTLTKQMGEAQKGTKKSADAFDKLGISVTDNEGNLKSQEDMLWETLEALNNMENQSEKAAIAQQLFGRTGQELMPLINGARGSIEDMREEAHKLGLVLDDETIDAGVNFTDTMDKLKRSFDSVTTKIGAKVMPMAQAALDFVLDHMPEIQAALDKVFTFLTGFLDYVSGIADKYIRPVLESTVDMLKKIFDGDFKGAFEGLKNIFQSVWSGITGWFSEIFENVKNAVTGIDWAGVGTTILDFIETALSDIVSWATEWYESLSAAIQEVNWEDVGNWIWDKIEAAFNGVFDFFSGLFSDAKTGVENGIDWLGLGTAIWNLIKSAFGAVATTFLTIFSRAKETIANIHWLEMASAIWDKIVEGLGNIVENLAKFFEDAAAAILEVDWLQLGKDIWNGIKSAFASIGSAFMGFFSDAKTQAKNKVDWAGLGTAIWDLIKAAFLGIAKIFKGFFEDAWEEVKKIDWLELGQKIWDGIKSAFGSVLSFFLGKFSGAKDTIKNIHWADLGTAVWGLIKDAFINIGSWFREKFQNAWSAIKLISWSDLGLKIWGFITEKFTNIGKWFKERFEEAVQYLLNIDWAGIGRKMYDDISGWVGTLQNKFSSLANTIASATGTSGYQAYSYYDKLKARSEAKGFASAYDHPVMFTRPTVIGTNRGLMQFGDRPGAEIVLSEARLARITGSGDTVHALNTLTGIVQEMNDNMDKKLAMALSQLGLSVDGREFARLVRNVRTA